MDSRKRVVITGIGPISSVGIGKDNFWQGILQKKLNLKKERYFVDGELWEEFYLHKVEGFDISKFGIDEDKLDDIKEWKESEEIIDLNYLIAAVKLALDDGNIDYSREENNLALVLAHENISLMPFGLKISNVAYDTLINKGKSDITKKEFFDKFYRNFMKSGYDVQSFADLFHVARVFNVHNYSLFINNACASGLYALEAASQIINSKQAKIVVIAASDYPEIYKYLWFYDLGKYSSDGIIRPFCLNSNGIVLGDGGVGVVLEDLEHARGRNASIYAEYLGGGFDLEGWKITVPQIGGNSYQEAIGKAFKHSNLDKREIDLICPHGVGSAPIDYYEAKAITDTFGKMPSQPLISAFKPYIGHTLGCSALLETALLLLCLKNNTIPPTLNCDPIDPRFNITLVREKTQKELNTVMKISCAFAGFNAAAIFRKV